MAALAVHRRRDAGLVGPCPFVEGQGGVRRVLLIGQVAHLIVEAGHREAPAGIGEGGEHPHEHVGGVVDSAAVLAGVHVMARAVDADLPVGDPPQAVPDGGRAVIVEGVAVADHAHIGTQQVGMLLDERFDRLGSDLLVALEEEAKVDGQPPGRRASTPRLP